MIMEMEYFQLKKLNKDYPRKEAKMGKSNGKSYRRL